MNAGVSAVALPRGARGVIAWRQGGRDKDKARAWGVCRAGSWPAGLTKPSWPGRPTQAQTGLLWASWNLS